MSTKVLQILWHSDNQAKFVTGSVQHLQLTESGRQKLSDTLLGDRVSGRDKKVQSDTHLLCLRDTTDPAYTDCF